MKKLTDQELLEEINLCADIFIRSSSDEVAETYEYSFEELQAFLLCFGDGLVRQLNETNKTRKLFQKVLLFLQSPLYVNGIASSIAFKHTDAKTLHDEILKVLGENND